MKSWLFGIGLVPLLAGCNASGRTTAAVSEPAQEYRGWYMEHAGQGSFQACGESQPWRITASSDLPARARKFGLTPDSPVYVRVTGTARDNTIAVTAVQQFGSPTPVRDCAMTGVVIPVR